VNVKLNEAVDYISRNIHRPISLKEVAAAVYVSPYHFHRIFKQAFGLTLKKYIQQHRLEQAFMMIMNGSLGIADIALKIGYQDYETFSRAFKRQHKIAPDDLKAIVQKVVANLNEEKGNVRKVLVFSSQKEVAPDKLISNIITELMRNNIKQNELLRAKVVLIRKASDKRRKSCTPEDMVKNKFIIMEQSKQWSGLVQKMS
jgi:AraC-like DNA-binding protein